MPSAMTLSSQVILITGASAGIGAALAEGLAVQYLGIRLVLAARRVDKLNLVAEVCRKAGATVLVVPTDMAQTEQIQALARQALEHFGRVDVLVNNAGYGQMGPIELQPLDAVQRQFQVNVCGVVTLVQAVIPVMREQGQGRIINISSIAGRTAFPFGGLYSASKFALEALSDTLRMELEPFNIKVSVIEPGPVRTEFFAVVNQEISAGIPTPGATVYRAAFQQMAQLEDKTQAQAWTCAQVVTVILRAMTAQNPRPRYIAATGGEILVFLLTKVLPRRWVDRFWQRFYAIDRVTQDWRSQLQELNSTAKIKL
jgi:short-subunit dehydrogenase